MEIMIERFAIIREQYNLCYRLLLRGFTYEFQVGEDMLTALGHIDEP